MLKDGEITLKLQVLRKRIRSLEDGTEKIVYTSDPRTIAKFHKRMKQVIKLRPAPKQKQNATVMSLAEITAMMNYGQSDATTQDVNQTSVISIPHMFSKEDIEMTDAITIVTNKAPKKPQSKQRPASKKAIVEHDSEDDEVYIPGTTKRHLATKRSEPLGQQLFNQSCEEVIDSCIRMDVHRIFF